MPSNAFDSRPAKAATKTGAEKRRADAAPDLAAAPRHRFGDGEHDADDQAGFDHFAQNDDESADHSELLRAARRQNKKSSPASFDRRRAGRVITRC